MTRINGFACFALVALRLVIGWHFLVEGVHKIQTHRIGRTSTNTPWTCEGFFREGYGPAAALARQWLQISETDATQRFRIEANQCPPALAKAWQADWAAFVRHYSMTSEQEKAASEKFDAAFKSTLAWLKGDETSEVRKSVLWGNAEFAMTVPRRLAEYDAATAEIRDISANRRPKFNQDVDMPRLNALKADAAKILAELENELNTRETRLKADLQSVLTEGQKSKGLVPETPVRSRIHVVDSVTMYSLAALGGCLVIGLFSRLASALLFVFLLSVTLIAPAVPFAPAPPGGVGHYLYVNLHTIEMVALLALSSLPTGQWFGLDAIVSFRRPPRQAPVRPIPPVAAARS